MPPGTRNIFLPGNNANPSGRPPKTPEMREAEALAKSRTPDAVRRLLVLMESSEDDRVQLLAANSILDRAFGKPAQAITGPEGEPLLPNFDTRSLSDADLGTFIRFIQTVRVEPAQPVRALEAGASGAGGHGDPPSGDGESEPR